MAQHPLIAETERWFLARGVPQLIDNYAAGERVWTRARAFLIAVLLAQTIWAFGDRYAGFRQGFAFGGVLIAMFIAVGLFNKWRGRRLFDVPDDVGIPELAFFVFAAPVLTIVISNEPFVNFVLSVGTNLVILGITWVVVGFGLIPLCRWAIGILVSHFKALARLLARTLPMLLILTVFMFINAEIWQVANLVPEPTFVIVNAILVLVGLSFMWLASGTLLEELDDITSWEEAAALAVDTPLQSLPEPEGELLQSDLNWRANLNIRLVMIVSLGVQVALVALLVAAFYVAIGLLLVNADVLAAWAGTETIDSLASWQWGQLKLVLTAEHLRVAGLVGTLAGLNTAVVAQTDEIYRDTFAADLRHEIRENIAVRRLYRTLITP